MLSFTRPVETCSAAPNKLVLLAITDGRIERLTFENRKVGGVRSENVGRQRMRAVVPSVGTGDILMQSFEMKRAAKL